MPIHFVTHVHRFGTDVCSVEVAQNVDSSDVAAALILRRPDHYEIGREDEEVRAQVSEPPSDATEEVATLLWLRELKLGDRVGVMTNDQAVREGQLHWVDPDPETLECLSGPLDFGPLFARPDHELKISLDDGGILYVHASDLRRPPQPSVSVRGPRRMTVVRTETRTMTIEIADCESDEDARNRALEIAVNQDFRQFSAGDAEYAVESVQTL